MRLAPAKCSAAFHCNFEPMFLHGISSGALFFFAGGRNGPTHPTLPLGPIFRPSNRSPKQLPQTCAPYPPIRHADSSNIDRMRHRGRRRLYVLLPHGEKLPDQGVN